ncbi:MAG: protein kinase domain-containing protein [Terriglobales bacterium]
MHESASRYDAARKQDLSGVTLGRFHIQNRLGAGGMGEVYRAEDTMLRRVVAIKRLSSTQGASEGEVSRLLREGQRASALNHPNIASIYDVFEHQDEVMLVMEYVEGVTLRDRLATSMSKEEFIGIAVECAGALAAAHEKGILHSDIKPENIMLTPGGHVKLLDFGVARRVAGENDTTRGESLQNSSLMAPVGGTPAYMAPEVLLGSLPDLRADVFSLGLVYYEMLAGKHPFRGDSSVPVMARIVQETASPLRKQNTNVGQPLADVIGKAMQRKPADRYPSAELLAADLRLIEQGLRPKIKLPGKGRAAAITLIALGAVAALALLLLLVPAVRTRIFDHRNGSVAVGTNAMAQQTLAFLPVSVAGDDPALKAFADGLAASVTSKLSQLSENHTLDVVSSSQIRDKKVTKPQEAYQQFGANTVLQMDLQKSGELLRASFTLIESKSGRTLSGDTITAPISNPFDLQDQVAGSVVRALKIQLRPDEQVAINMHGTAVPAAYQYYLQGVGYLHDSSAKPELLENALTMLSQALKLDANFGVAQAARGETLWAKYQVTKDKKWIAPAQSACDQAVALANSGAAGHRCLGLLQSGTGKYEAAATEFQRALQLEPTNDDASIGLARAYTSLNRLDEAEETYQRVIKLRPNYYRGYAWLAYFYIQQAQYEKAAQIYQKLTTLAPENPESFYNLGAAYLFLGKDQEAIAEFEKSIRIRPSPAAYSNLGTAYFRARKYAEAARNYREAINSDERDHDLWNSLGSAYYYGGDRTQAKAAFQKALSLANEQLQINPHDASLQGDVASLYARLGQRKESLEHLDRSLQIGHGDKDLWFNAAVVYNDLGDTPMALEFLQKAITSGYSTSTVAKTATFDNLLSNPRFQELLKAR